MITKVLSNRQKRDMADVRVIVARRISSNLVHMTTFTGLLEKVNRESEAGVNDKYSVDNTYQNCRVNVAQTVIMTKYQNVRIQGWIVDEP